MHLWTEYEGRTVAGGYTLGKLLRSEGRNGFFATADKKGKDSVIRLTESHYDEDELLQRWQHVARIQQEHLIDIERVGKTNLDGVALTFALMESNDASLAEVLAERPLTLQETMQVARAVSTALVALHADGMVHEHLEPENVLAVGEVVKLRSDCVRECVADKEFNTPEGCAELRRKDVRDFGLLLLRCLTLEKELRPNVSLGEPFYRLIPGAIDGTLSIEVIDAVLNPPVVVAPVVAPQAVPAATVTPAPVAAERVVPELPLHFRPRNRRRADETAKQEVPWQKIAVYGGGAMLLVILLWSVIGGKHNAQPAAAVAAPAAAAQAVVVQPAPVALVKAAAPAVSSAAGWHVIAFTYNREPQAQAKVEKLASRHPGLRPQVFSPSGRAPFYVALGGPMSREDAGALLRTARRDGAPRDTFVRNF